MDSRHNTEVVKYVADEIGSDAGVDTIRRKSLDNWVTDEDDFQLDGLWLHSI